MSWLRGRRRLAVLGAVLAAVAGIVVLLVAVDEPDAPRPGLLTADAPTTTSGSGTAPSSAPTSTSTVPSASTTSVPATTTRAPAPQASRGPGATTTVPPTTASSPPSTTAPSTTTTSTTIPSYSADDCPDPAPSSDFAAFEAGVVAIRDGEGVHRSCMLIADTPERRRQGLMGQDDLDGYAGMAFLFDDEQERSFWMHDTRIPLSIAFFDAEGAFVSAEDMEPCDQGIDCPTYSSDGPAQFAVEVPQGQLASVGATPGSTFESEPS